MLTNFQISQKTKRPACCDWDCCGCHFGRISYRQHRNKGQNRIIKARRYAKRVERRLVQLMIMEELG